ncbi:UDP:flavonoid glycosyltransferase YjiC (YdhE family) [Prauserella isguenensis]|uniref:UDP:flavonoid glycosyltransferase YjiC (YdhE family) n=1 Tax=Prauserella isguenensis TaxID=1470180 RepID=A0A839S757_9PSEU|nr:nucleotide disphospho-sugar-binding domain-containing protein [Prauserella isguenensis]MBB3053103.1 UDP:flavonoid glycosyltransferase YjiC (YdhE family) [Prauserella isguenensis]
MRVLAVTNPAEGHFFPMVPFLWALRAAGHEVLVGAAESFLPHVTGAGMAGAATAPPMEMVEIMRPDTGDRAPQQPPTESAARAGTGEGFGRLAMLNHTGVGEICATWKPDVIVGETSAYAAGIAASRAGCPHVEFLWGIPLHTDIHGAGLEALARQELEPAPPMRTIGVCPPSFLVRGQSNPDWAMRYVPYNGPAHMQSRFLAQPERPRVLVTLGTVLPRYGDVGTLVSDLVAALNEQDLDVVVAMRESDRAKLGDPAKLPGPVREATWMPLAAVVGTCAAVVHHGGSGTTMTSLAYGVPQIVVPHFADQFVNAAHLVAGGCGVRARISTPASEIAGLVDQVLADPGYAERAATVARDCQDQAAPAQIAGHLTRSLTEGRNSV